VDLVPSTLKLADLRPEPRAPRPLPPAPDFGLSSEALSNQHAWRLSNDGLRVGTKASSTRF
jgi:hypothetical protein